MPDVLLEVIGGQGTKVMFYKRDDWLIGITVSSIDGKEELTVEVAAHHLLDVVRTWSAGLHENALIWRHWYCKLEDEKRAAQEGGE